MMNLVYIGLGLLAAIYLFVPAFRNQVNQLARIGWSKIFGGAATPLDRQKDALKQAIELMKQQKESVVKVTAAADLADKELRKRQDKVNATTKAYTDAKGLNLGEEDLNKLALRVKEAREAVTTQEANVKIAHANMQRANESLARTTKKLQQAGQNVLDNESKVELANALNVQAKAEEMAANIDNVLSEFGAANSEIDKMLAEAEARVKINQGDETDRRLEDAQNKADADAIRDELDGNKKQ